MSHFSCELSRCLGFRTAVSNTWKTLSARTCFVLFVCVTVVVVVLWLVLLLLVWFTSIVSQLCCTNLSTVVSTGCLMKSEMLLTELETSLICVMFSVHLDYLCVICWLALRQFYSVQVYEIAGMRMASMFTARLVPRAMHSHMEFISVWIVAYSQHSRHVGARVSLYYACSAHLCTSGVMQSFSLWKLNIRTVGLSRAFQQALSVIR